MTHLYHLFILIILTSCVSAPNYDLPYFKDGHFHNLEGRNSKSFFSYLWMRIKTTQKDWPNSVQLKTTNVIPPQRSKTLRVYYINHSTFLLQYDNLNILTDPVFSKRVSPISWAGPKRVIEPGIAKHNLPKIDLVLISHDHYDHLDVDSLLWLKNRDNPRVLAGLGVGRSLQNLNYQELRWGQATKVERSKVTFTPAQHFSGRGLFDRDSTLWGSFVIQFTDLNIYFAGDTGYSSHFKEVSKNFGNINLSLLPIGAYAPRYFMAYSHINPAEALQAHIDLKSQNSLGMHWGTFQLTNEGRLEPKQRLEELRDNKSIKNFWVPENGECYAFSKEGLEPCT